MEKLRLKGAPICIWIVLLHTLILIDNAFSTLTPSEVTENRNNLVEFASICIQPQIPGSEHSPQMAMRNEWEVTLKGPDLVQVEQRVFPAKSEFKLWVPSWMHYSFMPTKISVHHHFFFCSFLLVWPSKREHAKNCLNYGKDNEQKSWFQ